MSYFDVLILFKLTVDKIIKQKMTYFNAVKSRYKALNVQTLFKDNIIDAKDVTENAMK